MCAVHRLYFELYETPRILDVLFLYIFCIYINIEIIYVIYIIMSSFQSLFNESSQSINLIIAVDNISIDYNSSGQLEIKLGGVSTAKIANLAVTDAKINDMNASKLTGTITIPIDNSSITTNQITVAEGTGGVPSINFKGDLGTGITSFSPGVLSFPINGVDSTQIYEDGLYLWNGNYLYASGGMSADGDVQLNMGACLLVASPGVVIVHGGNVTRPAFSFEGSANGIYYSAANTTSVASNAIETLRIKYNLITALTNILANYNISVAGVILNSDGTAAAPSYSFTSATNLGIYKNSANTLSISSAGTEVARFNSALNQFYVPLAMGTNTINCGDITTSNVILSSGTANGMIYLNGTKYITSTVGPTNGQLLIGSTASTPVLGTLTGTTNRVTVTNGAGTITLSGPQDLATTSTPTFGSLTLTSNLTMSALTANGMAYISGTKNLASTASPTNGQILIGSTSTIPALGTITGTSNRITVTNGAGTITLSGPQDIATSSSPTFSSMTLTANLIANALNSQLIAGSAAAATNGTGKLQLYGTWGSTPNGPHILCTTSVDAYPTRQIFNYTHDFVADNFDCYSSGTNFVSAIVGSNFQILKNSNALRHRYAAGVTAGSTITFGEGTALNSVGQYSIGTMNINTASQKLSVYGVDNSSSISDNANIATYTSGDLYPLLHIQSQQHNNIVVGFDVYWDGSSYRSANSSSNFQIGKVTNQLKVLYGSGTASGSVPSLSVATYWDTSGNLTQNNNLSVAGTFSSSGQPALYISASTYMSVSDSTNTDFNLWDTSISVQGGITVTSSTTINIPANGHYNINVQMPFDASTAGIREIFVKKNGTTLPKYANIRAQSGTDINNYNSTQLMKLSAGDSLIVGVYQVSGANLHIGTLSTTYVALLSVVKMF